MPDILAKYNDGRWLVECPIHGTAGAVLAEPKPELSPLWTENNEYICPVCYPEITRMTTKLTKQGMVRSWDVSAHKTAQLIARANDEVYTVIFPDNKADIEDLLAQRPQYITQGLTLAARCWEPGETMEDLQNENALIEAAQGDA